MSEARNPLFDYSAVRIREDTMLCLPGMRQFRFPRSKRRRIRKKWLRRRENLRRVCVSDTVYRVGGFEVDMLLMCPHVAKLTEALSR